MNCENMSLKFPNGREKPIYTQTAEAASTMLVLCRPVEPQRRERHCWRGERHSVKSSPRPPPPPPHHPKVIVNSALMCAVRSLAALFRFVCKDFFCASCFSQQAVERFADTNPVKLIRSGAAQYFWVQSTYWFTVLGKAKTQGCKKGSGLLALRAFFFLLIVYVSLCEGWSDTRIQLTEKKKVNPSIIIVTKTFETVIITQTMISDQHFVYSGGCLKCF